MMLMYLKFWGLCKELMQLMSLQLQYIDLVWQMCPRDQELCHLSQN